MKSRTPSQNRARFSHLHAWPVIVLLTHAGMTLAQAPATAPAPTPAATPASTPPPAASPALTEPENPLAGPKVTLPSAGAAGSDGTMMSGHAMDEADLAKLTIVERDFAGQITRLDQRAEKAAAEKLPLTAQQRSELNEFFTERSTRVLQFTLKHYDQFIELQGARQARSREELPRLMSEMRKTAGEWIDKPLVDRVEQKLPENLRTHYRRMVGEYYAELAKSDPRAGASTGGGNPRPRRAGANAEYSELNNFIREMAREFSGMVGQRREQLDTMLRAVDATPEQESKIREIVRAGSGTPGTDPTPQQRRETIRKLLAELTPQQQKLWQQAQAAQRGAAPMPAPDDEPATDPAEKVKKTPAEKPASGKP